MLQKLLGNNPRTILIRKNIVASLLIKGWSTIVLFALVPLTLRCLGVYENGVWLTISSMLVWIDNLDVGLGNGLRNKLAESLALNDREKARRAVSSTFFMLITVILPACLLFNTLVWSTDIYTFLNVNHSVIGNLRTVLSVAISLVCATFVFKFIGNFYMGLQMPAVNNLLVTIGQTLMLCGTATLYLCNVQSLLAVTLVNTASPLLVYLISWSFTFRGKYGDLCPSLRSVGKDMVKELFSMGIKFFVLQLAGMMLFMSSNVIISYSFSPEMVTPYQIAYRYFCVAQLLFNIICMPYWTATTDAYRHGDMEWIRRSGRTLDKQMLIITGVVVLLLALSQPIFALWIGRDVEVPMDMTALVALYMLTMLISVRYSYIINGIGALHLQLVITAGAAIVYVPLAIGVSRISGNILCLLVVMSLVNLPGLTVNIIQYYKILRGTAHGIWIK